MRAGIKSVCKLCQRVVMLLLVAAIALLSGGCFTYVEEIWLDNDLSGTISIDLAIGELYIKYATEVGLDEGVFNAEGLKQIAAGIEGVELINADVYSAEDNRTIKLSLKFDDIEALDRIYSAIKGVDFIGGVTLEDALGGRHKFIRKVSLADPRITSIAGFDEKLKTRKWITKVHFPRQINETNAPETNIDQRTRQVVAWGYPIVNLTGGERVMEATFAKSGGIRPLPMLVAVAVFAAVIALMYKVVMPKKRHVSLDEVGEPETANSDSTEETE